MRRSRLPRQSWSCRTARTRFNLDAVNTAASDTAETTMPFAVRPLREPDIPQVRAIEKQAFSAAFPSTPFRRELGNRAARYWVAEKLDRTEVPTIPVPIPPLDRSPGGLVRKLLRPAAALRTRQSRDEVPNLVVGFLGTWYAGDEAHIVSVGVGDGYRRRGIGELLLIVAVEHATARQTETIILEVRRSNVAARSLYEKYGFIERGVRRAYYSDNCEDAVIMTTEPIQMAPYVQRIAALKQEHRERWGRAEINLGT